jgi:hypothetical protein
MNQTETQFPLGIFPSDVRISFFLHASLHATLQTPRIPNLLVDSSLQTLKDLDLDTGLGLLGLGSG